MKLMIIIPEFGYGGAETMVENLAICLKNSGNEVTVVSLYNTRTEHTARLEKNNVSVVFLGKQNGLDFSVIKKLHKLIRKIKPDAIHTHLYSLKYAAIASCLDRSMVIIHTVHNTAKKEMGEKDRRFNNILYHREKAIPVALSKEIQKSIIEEYNLEAEKVPIIYNGIKSTNQREKTSYSFDKKFIIIHVGRFQEQKNHICIIKAASILKNMVDNFEIRLFGNGPLIDEMRTAAEELKVSDCVCFMGTSEHVTEEMKKADIFILPSLWEGMPMTIIEAMNVGLPIIASDVGGVPDMIQNEKNGVLIQPSPEELANEIYRLYCNEGLRKQLGTTALRSAKLFTAEEMSRQYIDLYQRVAM